MRIIISVLVSLCYSCKTSKVSTLEVTSNYVKTYIDELVKKNIIGENPLLIYNDNVVRKWKAVGLNRISLRPVKKSLNHLKKQSMFYEYLFGE